MEGGALFTLDMFQPIITGITGVVPVAISAGAAVLGVTWVAKKGFSMVKSFMNKG